MAEERIRLSDIIGVKIRRKVTPQGGSRTSTIGLLGGQFQPETITSGGVRLKRVLSPTEESRKERAKLKYLTASTKARKLGEAEAAFTPAKNMVNQLEQGYFKAFPTAPVKGLKRFPYGARKSIDILSQSDPNAASYIATREAFLSMITRGLGEKGALAIKDIERIAKAVPDQFTSQATAKRNFKTITRILNSAKQTSAKREKLRGEVSGEVSRKPSSLKENEQSIVDDLLKSLGQ